MDKNELQRIRNEYSRRASDERLVELYSLSNPANLFAVQSRERAAVDLLRTMGRADLSGAKILDLGCGSGGELHRLTALGAQPLRLHGLDLLFERLQEARRAGLTFHFVQGNGGELPYRDEQFDMVLQFTVFSSVLDSGLKSRMASEMLRVLKAGGAILWYDYWLNPTNRATRGIRPGEIRRLFPGCRFRFRKVTLAPPIARRVVPVSWIVGTMLEYLPVLRSHYLVGIIKPGGRVSEPGGDLRASWNVETQTRPLAHKDIPAVVSAHRRVFQDYFLAHMGDRFLELLYCEFVDRPGNYGFVVARKDEIIGYVIGSAESGIFFRNFYRRNFPLVSPIFLGRFLSDPFIRRNTARRLAHVRYAFGSLFNAVLSRSPSQGVVAASSVPARLLSIGVIPEVRGGGVAEILVDFLCARFRQDGIGQVGLSVREDNHPAISFYERTGWKLERVLNSTRYYVRSTDSS